MELCVNAPMILGSFLKAFSIRFEYCFVLVSTRVDSGSVNFLVFLILFCTFLFVSEEVSRN